MSIILALIFSFVTIDAEGAAGHRVRRVEVHGDQIVTVRTCMGIATIIQVPDRPNSVVVGDQESFKVEYLDQAITIKPLSAGVKSNLYVYTDWKRYNVELVSGSEGAADYVVYLESPKEKTLSVSQKSFVSWTNFKNSLKNGNLLLSVKRLGKTRDGILLVEFTVKSTAAESFKPEWLWLTQAGVMKPIHNLYLSNLEVDPSRFISGVLQIKRTDIMSDEFMKLELRRSKISFLTLMKVDSWK